MSKSNYIIEHRGKPGVFDNVDKSWTTWKKFKAYKKEKSMLQALATLNGTEHHGKKYYEYQIKP